MKIAESLALGLICALAAGGSAQAQGQPKQFEQVLTVHARPEGAVDYEAFIKKVTAAAEKVGQNQRGTLGRRVGRFVGHNFFQPLECRQ